METAVPRESAEEGDGAVVGIHHPPVLGVRRPARAGLFAEVGPVGVRLEQDPPDHRLGDGIDVGVAAVAPRATGAVELLPDERPGLARRGHGYPSGSARLSLMAG